MLFIETNLNTNVRTISLDIFRWTISIEIDINEMKQAFRKK